MIWAGYWCTVEPGGIVTCLCQCTVKLIAEAKTECKSCRCGGHVALETGTSSELKRDSYLLSGDVNLKWRRISHFIEVTQTSRWRPDLFYAGETRLYGTRASCSGALPRVWRVWGDAFPLICEVRIQGSCHVSGGAWRDTFPSICEFCVQGVCHASGGDWAWDMCHVSRWIIVSIKNFSLSRVIIRLFFFSTELPV